MPASKTSEYLPSSAQILRLQLWSLLPITIVALLNSGYQYLKFLPEATDYPAENITDRIASGLGASHLNPGWYDMLAAGLAHLAPIFITALITGGLWERVIAEKRSRPFESGYVLIALLFSLLLPGSASLLHVVLGMSFAILIGKGIFGGEGRTFLSPALLGIAFVQVSFPGAASPHPLWNGIAGYSGSDAFARFHQNGESALATVDINLWSAFIGSTTGAMGTTSLLAITLGAALLLFKRIISWRLLAAQIIGLLVIAALYNGFGAESGISTLTPHWHLLLGGFAFAAVYLACDPVASCCTNPGRWIQGLLIGALVVLIRVENPSHPDAVIPVLLLASILAPLIDHSIIALNIRARGRRHV